MPCQTPYRDDSAQLLLYKIASCLADAPGGAGVSSFNGLTGDVVFTGADILTLLGFTPISESDGDARYVLKAGDTMTGTLLLPAGTNFVPSLSFSGDTNTGVFSPSADIVSMTAGDNQVAAFAPAIVTVFVNFSVNGTTSTFHNLQLVVTTSTVDIGLQQGLGSLFTIWGYDTAPDPNDPPVTSLVFQSDSRALDTQVIGFFSAATAGALVPQQSTPTDSLSEVIAALRAYGLLAP